MLASILGVTDGKGHEVLPIGIGEISWFPAILQLSSKIPDRSLQLVELCCLSSKHQLLPVPNVRFRLAL